MNILKRIYSVIIISLVSFIFFHSGSKIQAQSFNCCGCDSAVEVATYCDKNNFCYECTGPGDPNCPGLTGTCLSPAPACSCTPPSPPPQGGCSSSWCTSSSTCSAIQGSTQSSGAGYCSPPDLVQCCTPSGGGQSALCYTDNRPRCLGEGESPSQCQAMGGRQNECWIVCRNAGGTVAQCTSYCSQAGTACTCCPGLTQDFSTSGWPCICGSGGASCTNICNAPYCGQPNKGTCGGTCSNDSNVCPNSCGQVNACGRNCGTSDETPPSGTTTPTPANGATVTVTPPATTVTLSWTAMTKATKYNLQIYPTGTPSGQECTASGSACPTNLTTLNYAFTFTPTITSYTWRILPINGTCTPAVNGSWTSPTTFTIVSPIRGNFILDTTQSSGVGGNGLCQLGSGGTGQNPGASSTIGATWGGGGNSLGVISGSGYTISNVAYTNSTTVTLTPDLNLYSCVCPSSCSYTNTTSVLTSNNVNFYLSNGKQSWWQTSNGLIYAGNTTGTAVYSKIPATCTSPSCTPALSTRTVLNTTNSDSYVVSGGGAIDSTLDAASQYTYLRQDGTTGHILGATLNGPQEDYSYFAQLFGVSTTSTVDFTGTQPSSAPTNGKNYYANSDVTINSAWNLTNNQSMVIFVNGNLTINQPIHVAEGGFLAFIVNGNITVANTVGATTFTSGTPVVEGVYIADQQLIIAGGKAGGDLKFVGGGMFAGWGGVQLNRTYTTPTTNNTNPTDLFIYRPDFLLNAPPQLGSPLQLWQETN